MIYMFRKEIGKWKIILWPVLISIAASSLMMVRRSSQFATVATVNGRAITVREYSAKVGSLRDQINQLRAYARSSGLPVETFMQLHGLNDPAQAALDACVHEKLVEGALAPTGIVMHHDVVSSELLKSLQHFVNPDGSLNEAAYRQHIQQQRLFVADFEDRKEQEMLMNLFDEFARNGSYQPSYVRRDERLQSYQRKSFGIVTVQFKDALRQVKRHEQSGDELKKYYDEHREQYRVPEKRTATYWVLRPSSFEDSVEVAEDSIAGFYDKNKTKLYRISPQAKVRHIFIAEDDNAFERANAAYTRVLDKPDDFGSIAKELSENTDTAHSGGELDFFSRGTYDKDFEKAAFRLRDVGAVAPLTKVEGGYEIIQLVERIPASEKTLGEVRDEVVAAVRGKRALEWLRSNLEQLRRKSGNKKETLERLVSRAESYDSIKDVVQSKGNTYTKEGKVISHAYQLRERGDYTFFMHEDAYYLVQLNERVSSFVPAQDKVGDEVSADCYAQKATDEVVRLATRIHNDLVEGKERSAVADEHGAKESTTDLLSTADSKGEPFKSMPGALQKAFGLMSPSQVLRHKKDKDICLIQLVESKIEGEDNDGDNDDEGGEELRKSLDSNSRFVSNAFVASLRRSATLETNEKMLANQAR